MENKSKIAIFSGSGVSSESGIPTFRLAADSMWENHNVNEVCTHEAWCVNANFVNHFYNMLRVKYKDVQPNDAHKLIAELENDYEVKVITQNVDNLHEKAGSTDVLHLHGEIMKCCSDIDVENEDYWVTLPQEGFGESGYEIPDDYETADGGQLRPYIVFFHEPVPNYEKAIEVIQESDIVVVIGTSLSVSPANMLVTIVPENVPIYIIDPNDIDLNNLCDPFFGEAYPNIHEERITHIKMTGSEGMKYLIENYLSKK